MKKWQSFNLQLISKYRSVLMGIAILMITLCHLDIARSHHGLSGIKLGAFLHLFTVGVDIFMFLSGYGLFYSLDKKRDLLTFYKKRIKKLWPKYIIIAGITYLVFDVFQNKYGLVKYFEDLLFLSWIKHGSTRYWFVLAIFAFSMIYPLIYRIVKSDGISEPNKLLLFLLLFFSITAFLDYNFPRYQDFKIALERLPVFFLGSICGKLSKKGVFIRKDILWLIIISGLLMTGMQFPLEKYQQWLLHTHYMYYFSRALFGLAIIAIAIWIIEIVKQTEVRFELLLKALSYLGSITYEIYLFHQSWMIVFDSPPEFGKYLIIAVILPLLSGIFTDIKIKKTASFAHGG